MRKITLVAVIIVAIAMMIGVQSALAVKPAGTVGCIANGKVSQIWSSLVDPAPIAASGPWKLVVDLKRGEINFSATCKTAKGVVKYSAKGPAATIDTSDTDVITIEGVAFSVKKGTATQAFPALSPAVVRIEVDLNAGTLFVDVNGSGEQNIWGNVRDLKLVP